MRMTAARALQRLHVLPLVFGDPELIDAHTFLQEVAIAKTIIGGELCNCTPCRECRGTGLGGYGSDYWVCEQCDGYGVHLACRCFTGLRAEAVIEARKQLQPMNS